MKSRENNASRFFEKVTESRKLPPNVSIIVVTHIIPDRPPFLEALKTLANGNLGIIAKPKSIHPETYERCSKEFQFLQWDRKDLSDESIVSVISDWLAGQHLIIFDIGGYFSPQLRNLAKLIGNQLIGVIEDTENGVQKYENLGNLCCPVVSVARSPLKRPENYLVGQSIVFATESILRECDEILQGKQTVVFGYGQIGRSVANILVTRRIATEVVEIDPIRAIEALSHGFQTGSKEDSLARASVLICATGNSSMSADDFEILPYESYVVSVTSSDDEMDIKVLESEWRVTKQHEHVWTYEKDEKRINLLNNGNAVNFLYRSGNGDFIYLLLGEMIKCCFWLEHHSYEENHTVLELPNSQRTIVAGHWLRIFDSIQHEITT